MRLDNMKKVLLVTGDMYVGGIENQLMYLLRYADKTKYTFDLLTTRNNPIYREEVESYGGQYLLIDDVSKKRILVYFIRLFRLLLNGHYDVIHTHHHFRNSLILFTAFCAGVPVRISHSHFGKASDENNIAKHLIYQVLRFCIRVFSTHLIACSEQSGKCLYGDNITQCKKYSQINNSVEVSKYLNPIQSVPTDDFLSDDYYNILHVSSISPRKNQLFSLEIAKVFKARKEKARILCVGSGDWDYECALVQAIKDEDLGDYFKMLHIRNDVHALMPVSHALILPSLTEGMPLVLIEAQTAGLNCVVADTFSHEVDFNLGQIQWLSLDLSAHEWANAICMAAKSPKASLEDRLHIVKARRLDAKEFANCVCAIYEGHTHS